MHLTTLMELLEQEVGSTDSSRETLAEILTDHERRESASATVRVGPKPKKRRTPPAGR